MSERRLTCLVAPALAVAIGSLGSVLWLTHHTPVIHVAPPTYTPARPGETCRRLRATVERAESGEVLDDCDRRNIVDAQDEIGYLEDVQSNEGGWCWQELEACEAGFVSERACGGLQAARFWAVVDDIEACARTAEPSP